MLVSALQFFFFSPPLLYFTLFILGLFFGSFFNVIVLRAAQENSSWIKGRSLCDSCHKEIAWYDNIPLLSYLILKGKCRHCQEKISWDHPLTELLTGLVFVFAGFVTFNNNFLIDWSFSLSLVLIVIAISVLWLILLFDVRYQIIPDELVALILFLAVIKNLFLFRFSLFSVKQLVLELIVSLVLTIFFLVLRVVPDKLFGKKGLGWGDIKLAGPLALLLGFPQALVGFFCAFIIGGVWGIILLATGNKKLGQKIAFGPFLVLGSWLALVWGELIWVSYWQLL